MYIMGYKTKHNLIVFLFNLDIFLYDTRHTHNFKVNQKLLMIIARINNKHVWIGY